MPLGSNASGPVNVPRIVYFDYDRAEIRPQDREVIAAHARYLRDHPSSHVLVTGHTDPRGGAEYNLALGQRRAQNVERALTQLGVPAERIESVSYGEEQLASSEPTEAGYQLNRRAEFVYR
ncbi:MAG: OmpA family protein [Comamonas sp.]